MRQANIEFGVASLGAVVSMLGVLHAMQFPRVSAYLPTAVLSLLTLLLVVWAARAFVSLRREVGEVLRFPKPEVRRFTILVVASIVLIGAAPMLGFATAFLIFVPVTGYLLGYRNWQGLVLSAVMFTSLICLVFQVVLSRPLPTELVLRLL